MFDTPPHPYARGVIARPIGENVIQIEPETNGLERVVDWITLEEKLDDGELTTQHEFKDEVRCQFEQAGVTMWRNRYEQVVAGLFPEYRELLDSLPIGAGGGRQHSILTEDEVRMIRTRHAAGDRVAHMAEEYGVRPNTVSDIVHYKTWKDIAA